MKSKFAIIIGILFGVIVLAAVAAKIYVRTNLGAMVAAQAGFPVQIGQSDLTFFPLGLELQDVTADHAMAQVQAKNAQAKVSLLSFLSGAVHVTLNLKSARVELKPKPPETAPEPPATGKTSLPSESSLPLGIRFQINVDDTEIIHPASHLFIQHFEASGLDMRGPWRIIFDTGIKPAALPTLIPVRGQLELSRNGEQISVDKASVIAASLQLATKGSYNIQTGEHAFNLDGESSDLSQVPTPTKERFQGGLVIHLSSQQSGSNKLHATGLIKVIDVQGPLNISESGLVAKGWMKLNSNVGFDLNGDDLNFEPSQVDINLQSVEVQYKDLFKKPASIPLSLQMQFKSVAANLNADKLIFTLGPLKLNSQMQVNLKDPANAPAQIYAKIDPVNLSSMTLFSPYAAKYPVTGSLEAAVNYQGSLKNYKQALIDVQKLELKDFAYPINLKAKDNSWMAEGMVKGSVRAAAKTSGEKILGANVLASVNANDLKLNYGDMLHKEEKQTLTLSLTASSKDGQNLQLQNSEITTAAGTLAVSGRVNLQPNFDLNIKTAGINFEKLTTLIPMLKTYGLSGSFTSNMGLKGSWDSKTGIAGSPIVATGELGLNLNKYVYKSPPPPAPAKATAGKPAPPPPVEKPEPLAPQWPVVKNSKLAMKVKISEFLFNDLPVHNINTVVNLDQGKMRANGQLNVFSGLVNIGELNTSLVDPWPTTNMQMKYNNLQMREAVNWASADWKDQMSGLATGTFNSTVPFPKRADFLDNLKADGALAVNKGRFSSLKFQNLVRSKLASIPGVGSKSGDMKLQDVEADLNAQYKLEKKVMTFASLNLKTPQNDELQAKGTMGLDKSVNLEGVAYLSEAPVQGSIREANLDSKGRFVIPLKIQGKLDDPQIGFAEETIKQLLSKTAEYEGKKLQEKLKQDGVKGLEKEVKDKLKNLFGN